VFLKYNNVYSVSGLTTAYTENDRQHFLLRNLTALPLLLAAHMGPVFYQLQRQHAADSPAVADLLTYMETTRIVSLLWPPEMLSVYQQQVRTNNDLEGWHRRLNNVARRANLPFYLLVCLLHTEAQSTQHIVRLLSEGHVLRRTSKRYAALNKRLQTLRAQYASGQKMASVFLRAAAFLQLRNSE